MSVFTVLTWNVENLFRPTDGADEAERLLYKRKVEYLAATIDGVGPTVVALQEVGGEAAAADLQAAAGFEHLRVSKHPDPRGIRVALLSRVPLRKVGEVDGFPVGGLRSVPDVDGGRLTAMGRGALYAEARTDAGPVRVMTAHLKSKLLSYPGGRRYPLDENERARGAGFALLRRAAEASAVRVTLNRLMTGAPAVPTVLLGDLNDEPAAATTALLGGPEDGDLQRPDLGDPVRLYNLASNLPPARAYTRLYRGRRELIDHVMVSRALRLTLRSVDSLVEGLESITESVSARDSAVAPDHAPLLARFDVA